ncbi:MAG: helix-turn-helix domain-containing protein [Myxococcota bacterium]
MSTLRERNRQDKWRRIRKAAESLFAERGFAGTTTRAIADRAEVGVGTVYLYAKTKEDLLLRIFVESIEAAIDEGFATLPDAPIVDRLLHVYGCFFAFYRRDLALARVLVREMTLGDVDLPANVELSMSFNRRVAALLGESALRGELRRDLPAELAATNTFALYLISLVAWLNGFVDEAGRDAMLRASLNLQLEGLGPREES